MLNPDGIDPEGTLGSRAKRGQAADGFAGEPITRFCDERRFSARRRLELFKDACRLVHRGHEEHSIHGNLEPRFIRVSLQGDTPIVRVDGFGLATVIGPYMSPEQAAESPHDIDAASDVYALGMVLYELLVGELPFEPDALLDAGPDEIRRLVLGQVRPRPATRLINMVDKAGSIAARRRTDVPTLRYALRQDLDWVVMKAISPEPKERYGSVAEIVDDIDRHLSDQPVLARPTSAAYRVRKFVRRHRVG